ncbi:MAG TPA: DUF4476 domain-containing protein [Segetibacter sp.]
MKYFLSILIFTFYCLQAKSQEKHFVFIQSDNKQPFYVSINGKLFSSSASGYVIIPKLTEGSYNFSVGFAQNAFPEQNFDLAVSKKDLGYNLKNFTDKGWGLFNLQTLDITMAGSNNTNNVAKALSETQVKSGDQPILTFKKKTENVAAANSVHDTAKISENKISTDSLLAANINKEVTQPLVTNPAYKDSGSVNKLETLSDVKKVSESKGSDGVNLAYVETTGKINDTIQVIIPTTFGSNAVKANNSDTSAVINSKKISNSNGSENEVKFLDLGISGDLKKEKSQVEKKPQEISITTSGSCANVATEEDYARLRKKMAKESTDEDMIAEAKKAYKNRCFTTSQVKALSTLFLSDEGRYNFFESSYSSVADAQNFSSLQTEFIDATFANRLKVLVK